MKRVFSPAAFALLIALSAGTSLHSIPAHAGLGHNEQDGAIEDDRKAVSGVLGSTTSHGNYTVQEIATKGRTMREYVSSDGKVFGIAWEGINHPDLAVVLGDYYGEFGEVSKKSTRGMGRRSHRTIQSANTVVIRSGHMRSFRGKAYAPSLIPEGVTADDVR